MDNKMAHIPKHKFKTHNEDPDVVVEELAYSHRQLAEGLRLLELRLCILEEVVARLKVSLVEARGVAAR